MSAPRKPKALCACGCEHQVFKTGYKFYSNKCQQHFEYLVWVANWKAGIESGSVGSMGQISKHLRKYLLQKYNYACSECGWSKRHPLTGNVPLETDHINGDSLDNREENLRLLCPNCHSLTNNFRALNWGKGRVNRK